MSLAMLPYDLTDEMADVQDALLENGGELTPEIEDRLAALQGASVDETQRIENIMFAVRNLDLSAASLEPEIERLQKLSETRKKAAARLKEYVRWLMASHDVKKLNTGHFNIWRQLAGRPSIRCEGDWPDELTRIIPERREPDGQAAYDLLLSIGRLPTEAGAVEVEIFGKKLIVERSEFLRVK